MVVESWKGGRRRRMRGLNLFELPSLLFFLPFASCSFFARFSPSHRR